MLVQPTAAKEKKRISDPLDKPTLIPACWNEGIAWSRENKAFPLQIYG